jgi:hypothetical protein
MDIYYQNYHNDIYKNFIYNKNKKIEIWNNNPDIIIDDFITKIKEFPKYIIDVFNDINTKIQDGDEYSYINIFEKFNDKLNKKLDTYLKKYLNL